MVTSSMTLGEVLVKPTKLAQTSLIEQYDHAIRSSAQLFTSTLRCLALRFASRDAYASQRRRHPACLCRSLRS